MHWLQSLSLDNFIIPNLHKSKMAAITTYFTYISSSEPRMSFILVSTPMFSGARNTLIAIISSLDLLIKSYLHKSKIAAITTYISHHLSLVWTSFWYIHPCFQGPGIHWLQSFHHWILSLYLICLNPKWLPLMYLFLPVGSKGDLQLQRETYHHIRLIWT